jgi:signal transduction histidine kinase
MIPLTDLLEEVVDQYLAQAAQKQIVLKMTEFPEISVLGEPSQLKRLFGNLIANAVHYTPAGGLVTLSAGVQDDEVWVQVTDTGIGIAPEQVPFVFDRFWRADQARAWREGGSGLGLAIAWAIAHQHRGQITVRSQPGQGSCFQVELPVA